MNAAYPVAGLWLAFLFAGAAFLTRKKPYGKFFQTLAIVTVSLSGVLFLWWAMGRTLASLPA